MAKNTKPPVENRPNDEFFDLDLAHISMQFSDTVAQQVSDTEKVFKRGYHGITGTEVGEPSFQKILRLAAHEYGYALDIYASNWVAVRKDLIKRGSLQHHKKFVVDNDEMATKGHNRAVNGLSMETEGIGTWSLLASHYAVKGTPVVGDPDKVNLDVNKKLAIGIGNLADKLAIGRSLVFYGGDQNIVDEKADTFFGESLTSTWDELNKYQNTGHGNIDVVASHDKDGRVEARYVRAFSDEKLHFHSDHFLVESGFRVARLTK